MYKNMDHLDNLYKLKYNLKSQTSHLQIPAVFDGVSL